MHRSKDPFNKPFLFETNDIIQSKISRGKSMKTNVETSVELKDKSVSVKTNNESKSKSKTNSDSQTLSTRDLNSETNSKTISNESMTTDSKSVESESSTTDSKSVESESSTTDSKSVESGSSTTDSKSVESGSSTNNDLLNISPITGIADYMFRLLDTKKLFKPNQRFVPIISADINVFSIKSFMAPVGSLKKDQQLPAYTPRKTNSSITVEVQEQMLAFLPNAYDMIDEDLNVFKPMKKYNILTQQTVDRITEYHVLSPLYPIELAPGTTVELLGFYIFNPYFITDTKQCNPADEHTPSDAIRKNYYRYCMSSALKEIDTFPKKIPDKAYDIFTYNNNNNHDNLYIMFRNPKSEDFVKDYLDLFTWVNGSLGEKLSIIELNMPDEMLYSPEKHCYQYFLNDSVMRHYAQVYDLDYMTRQTNTLKFIGYTMFQFKNTEYHTQIPVPLMLKSDIDLSNMFELGYMKYNYASSDAIFSLENASVSKFALNNQYDHGYLFNKYIDTELTTNLKETISNTLENYKNDYYKLYQNPYKELAQNIIIDTIPVIVDHTFAKKSEVDQRSILSNAVLHDDKFYYNRFGVQLCCIHKFNSIMGYPNYPGLIINNICTNCGAELMPNELGEGWRETGDLDPDQISSKYFKQYNDLVKTCGLESTPEFWNEFDKQYESLPMLDKNDLIVKITKDAVASPESTFLKHRVDMELTRFYNAKKAELPEEYSQELIDKFNAAFEKNKPKLVQQIVSAIPKEIYSELQENYISRNVTNLLKEYNIVSAMYVLQRNFNANITSDVIESFDIHIDSIRDIYTDLNTQTNSNVSLDLDPTIEFGTTSSYTSALTNALTTLKQNLKDTTSDISLILLQAIENYNTLNTEYCAQTMIEFDTTKLYNIIPKLSYNDINSLLSLFFIPQPIVLKLGNIYRTPGITLDCKDSTTDIQQIHKTISSILDTVVTTNIEMYYPALTECKSAYDQYLCLNDCDTKDIDPVFKDLNHVYKNTNTRYIDDNPFSSKIDYHDIPDGDLFIDVDIEDSTMVSTTTEPFKQETYEICNTDPTSSKLNQNFFKCFKTNFTKCCDYFNTTCVDVPDSTFFSTEWFANQFKSFKYKVNESKQQTKYNRFTILNVINTLRNSYDPDYDYKYTYYEPGTYENLLNSFFAEVEDNLKRGIPESKYSEILDNLKELIDKDIPQEYLEFVEMSKKVVLYYKLEQRYLEAYNKRVNDDSLQSKGLVDYNENDPRNANKLEELDSNEYIGEEENDENI